MLLLVHLLTTRHEMDIWPDLRLMTSTGLPAIPGNGADREPKGDEIIYISADEASKIWGPRVYMMEGTTWLWNDGQCRLALGELC